MVHIHGAVRTPGTGTEGVDDRDLGAVAVAAGSYPLAGLVDNGTLDEYDPVMMTSVRSFFFPLLLLFCIFVSFVSSRQQPNLRIRWESH